MANDQLEILRHSCAHLLAAAVLEMFPEAKLGIGPAVENGFYYDFDLPRTLIPEDLPLLEEKMKALAAKDLAFEKSDVSLKEALASAEKSNQPYKKELIEELKTEQATFYKTGNFVDLCRGPHVKSTKELAHFKLLSIAGAYWRGDETKPMLQRIYGTCFTSDEELQKYLQNLEEAKKRDHRKLGRELDLFVMSELVGSGLPLYTPKGTILRKLIVNYSRELRRETGYQEVHTPQINKAELFKVSGHYDKYKDSMFSVFSNYSKEEFFLKPMNCPQHVQIYAAKMRSYKDLPIRYSDFANLYRDEKPGELNGLVRLRSFSQDDGHCFCREDQIEGEIDNLLKVVEKAMKKYEMSYYIRLSLRDEAKKADYIGDDEAWVNSEKILENLLVAKKLEFVKAPGEAAFYGPKLDLLSRDSLGREWQLSTIQLDFNMPKRFDLSYTDVDGKPKVPVMIHAALIGSPERFIGILLEHYAGALPVWLSPIQAVVIPVSEKHLEYSDKVGKTLANQGIRATVDDRVESVNRRIREAEIQKIPFILVVGEREEKDQTISIRHRSQKELQIEKLDAFVNNWQD